MPHDSDVQPTSHDRHDTMLVAALAAGDLAATDRDQAISLTATCADCATLRDDLVAIARVTAGVPPPISAHNRDFRLTPADAARLRPGGWRRLVAAFSAPRLAVTRPLGVGLTTLGLVGLLIGNIPLNIGSSAGVGSTTSEQAGRAVDGAGAPAGSAALPPAASSGSEVAPVSGPASSSGTAYVGPDAAASGSPLAPGGVDIQGGPGGSSGAAGGKTSPASREQATADQDLTVPAGTNDPFRPINVLFIVAVLLGLGLLIASRARIRSRT